MPRSRELTRNNSTQSHFDTRWVANKFNMIHTYVHTYINTYIRTCIHTWWETIRLSVCACTRERKRERRREGGRENKFFSINYVPPRLAK